MAHELRAEVDIDAAPSVVWAILTDLAAFAEWNPFITSAGGSVAVGERLTTRIEPPGGRTITFKPTVTEVDEVRVLEWLGRLVVPGLFDGRHRFELVAKNGGTRFIQTERFSGVFVPLLTRRLDAATLAGFEAMNTALKARAESPGALSDVP